MQKKGSLNVWFTWEWGLILVKIDHISFEFYLNYGRKIAILFSATAIWIPFLHFHHQNLNWWMKYSLRSKLVTALVFIPVRDEVFWSRWNWQHGLFQGTWFPCSCWSARTGLKITRSSSHLPLTITVSVTKRSAGMSFFSPEECKDGGHYVGKDDTINEWYVYLCWKPIGISMVNTELVNSKENCS